MRLENVINPDGAYVSPDSLALTMTEKPDTFPPSIISKIPDNGQSIVLGEYFECEFNLPVSDAKFEIYYDILDSAAGRLDSLGNIIPDTLEKRLPGKMQKLNPYKFIFSPDEIAQGNWRNPRWKLSNVKGINGYEYSDTAWTKFRFTSIKKLGSLKLNETERFCNDIIYNLIRKNASYSLFESDSGYIADKINAGDYILYGFCDNDGDSLYNSCSIVLKRDSIYSENYDQNGLNIGIKDIIYSEKVRLYSDSLQIRGNWITDLTW